MFLRFPNDFLVGYTASYSRRNLRERRPSLSRRRLLRKRHNRVRGPRSNPATLNRAFPRNRAVGENLSVPEGTETIDATGKYVLPGRKTMRSAKKRTKRSFQVESIHTPTCSYPSWEHKQPTTSTREREPLSPAERR